MKVILFMTQTINGIIARKNFKEDFLSDENWKEFLKLIKETNCFIVGRKTYQEVQKWKDFNFDNIKATKIIVSHNKIKLNPNYILANSPKDAINKAKKLNFKKVILTGGSTLNSSFMKNNLIDEIILNVEPCVLGKGINIFNEDNFENKLKLFKVKKFKSGIVQLYYKIIQS